MKKKITLICSICVLGALALAGCSNSEVRSSEELSIVETATGAQTEETNTKTKMWQLCSDGIISGVENIRMELDREKVLSKKTTEQINNQKTDTVTNHGETVALPGDTKPKPQETAKQQGRTTSSHQHKWIEKTETIHHDAVTHQEPTYTTVHHDAVYENVWIEDSAAWDEVVGYRAIVECTDCWATFVAEGATGEAAYEAAVAQWRSHSFSVH